MSAIFYDILSINEILTSELRIRENEGILNIGLDKLKEILSQCKSELAKKYGSWENVGDPFVSLIKDMDDLSKIILEKKTDFPRNVRIYLCDALAYKLEDLAKIWDESDIE